MSSRLPTPPTLSSALRLPLQRGVVLTLLGGCSGCPERSAAAKPSTPQNALAEVVATVPLIGICEPSGAAILPDGTVWIADDDQDDVLFTWRPPGTQPERHRTVKPDKNAPARDIEGLAWKEPDLWVLGSHSRSRKGNLKRRARLRSLHPASPGEPGVELSLWPDEDSLESSVLSSATARLCPDCTPETSWADLNLEGVAMLQGTEQLLLGARAPLNRDGSAYVFALLPSAETNPIVGLHTLPLGRRGIRALSPLPDGEQLLLLAGPPQDARPADGQFAVYAWHPGSLPVLLTELPRFDGSPEALVPTGGSEAWVLLDEGDRLKKRSESDLSSPHRKQSVKGLRFACGAGDHSAASEHWAHAVLLRWSEPASSPATAP